MPVRYGNLFGDYARVFRPETPQEVIAEQSDAAAALVNVILQGIAARGYYFLRDNRLKLVCGEDFDVNNLNSTLTAINAFAEKHQWRAYVVGSTITFAPFR